MKVLCIKRDTKETSEDGIISSFVPSLLVEGSEYIYIGTYYYDKEYWHLEEFSNCSGEPSKSGVFPLFIL